MLMLLSSNPYIPWDTDMFLKAFNNLRGVIGTAFNVGMWIFIGIMGLLITRAIISYLVS